jgi:hypothetical protein
MNFQSSRMWFWKGPLQLGKYICNNSHLSYSNENFKPYTLACNRAMDKLEKIKLWL